MKKGDAGSRPEQHRSPDDMQIFMNKIQHHRSSEIARATKCNTIMGQIFSIGPSGSAQSRGTSIVPMMA
jgi:hypothetical protein